MPSPVPKHIITESQILSVPKRFREHIEDLVVVPPNKRLSSQKHPAKYAPGLSGVLFAISESKIICDPMAGTGRFFEETDATGTANDIDPYLANLMREKLVGVRVHNTSAEKLPPTSADCVIFSPPYYPRTDRKKPNSFPKRRGKVVGFRDSYNHSCSSFIGNPGGKDAILDYRKRMTSVYRRMIDVAPKMIVVTKNWTRLGVELRLDIDTIIMAHSVGWNVAKRHGWKVPGSLWSRYNRERNTGVSVEDVLVFTRA